MSEHLGHSPLNGTVPDPSQDPRFQAEVQRLYQLTLYTRWLVVGSLWLTVGCLSVWSLRSSIQLWLDHFTWAAVKYTLAYNRIAAIGLGLCLGTTFAVLLWQSRIILWGLPSQEQYRLTQRVMMIRTQGQSHPLWRWVCKEAKH
ncbi:MAG: hypothetical protein HC934_00065 [Acaryochloridaceae cyanobacterium SU_2_1]|nr:hypothetical protein [Acaryochloridaceae cyanobacterium SU_2_1]